MAECAVLEREPRSDKLAVLVPGDGGGVVTREC